MARTERMTAGKHPHYPCYPLYPPIPAIQLSVYFPVMKCPVCRADASGKFCDSCGGTLTSQQCPHCGADVKAGARFCQLCGRGVGASAGRRAALPWIVAGTMVAALAAVLLFRLTTRAQSGGANAAEGVTSGAATTDISNMSPGERADRLYNRVMAAAERGDSSEMNFFGPMALQAYDLLGGLDTDARYHIGMMQLALRNPAGARAQADTIARQNPGHLLGSLLKAEIARGAGDTAGRNRALRDLLAHYDREMATGREEYADHRTALETARAEASKAPGRTP